MFPDKLDTETDIQTPLNFASKVRAAWRATEEWSAPRDSLWRNVGPSIQEILEVTL